LLKIAESAVGVQTETVKRSEREEEVMKEDKERTKREQEA
jgi:hypothetical protein